jgi:anti-anti-sigma factor
MTDLIDATLDGGRHTAIEPVPITDSPEVGSAVTLQLQWQYCGRTVWIRLHGVLNWRTTPQFREAMARVLKRPWRRVVLDFTPVQYVGGNGLRALQALHALLSVQGRELRLVAPEGSGFARSLILTGLEQSISTYSHPAAAWRQ